ncbi:DNA gyrase subunit B [Kitasatospora sp. NPDC004289]
MSTENHAYDASAIQVLEGLDAIRKRPGMYVGSTGERGLHHLASELACHAMNGVLAEGGGRVDVTLLSDGGFRVRSEVGVDPVEFSMLLTDFSFCFGAGARRGEIMLAGPGMLCAVNALSTRTELEVRHDGIRWEAGFARGRTVKPVTEAGAAEGSSVTVAFWPDPEVFDTTQFSQQVLADAYRQLAFLYRELSITFTDGRGPGEPRAFGFGGDLRGFVAHLDGEESPDVIGFGCDDPRMPGELEVALRWRPGGGEAREWSFANGLRTEGGGTHVEGLRRGLRAAVSSYGYRRELRTAAAPEIAWDRISDGLTAVVSVKLDDHLSFEGAIRDKLGNPAVAPCVEEAVRDHVTAWLETHPAEADALVGRMLLG